MKIQIKYQHTSIVQTSHTINRQEKEIWIVFHGYGQLAHFFLRKFQPLFREDRLIVAPEATNYSYLEGYSGRIGANWMTSHEREIAITNNHQYLNTLLESLLEKYQSRPKIKVLGFSQGAATATRWVGQLSFPIHTLVLWGGGFAHDLSVKEMGQKLKETETHIANGSSDGFMTPEVLKKQEALIQNLNVAVKKHTYPGGHELYFPLLGEIFQDK